MTVATELPLSGLREESRLRILLVEDDPNDAELVQACLAEAARSGAEIVHAASLDAGLRALEGQDFHITVLDLDLPDSSGFDTLEKLGAAARTPVIVVTGNPHPALIAEGLKRRAYEVLKKSELDARSLMRVVRLATLQGRTEKRYRVLIETSREAIGLFGARGELVYGNPAMHAMLWSEANLIDLAHPTERETVQAQYAELAATRHGRITLKAHFRHHDGSWRMLEAALHNRLQDADVAAVVASFADLSPQAELEEPFRATFDQAAVGIAHVGEHGRFQLVNRKLCQILGYTREELSAMTVFDVSHAEDRDVTDALRRNWISVVARVADERPSFAIRPAEVTRHARRSVPALLATALAHARKKVARHPECAHDMPLDIGADRPEIPWWASSPSPDGDRHASVRHRRRIGPARTARYRPAECRRSTSNSNRRPPG